MYVCVDIWAISLTQIHSFIDSLTKPTSTRMMKWLNDRHDDSSFVYPAKQSRETKMTGKYILTC